MRFCLLLIVVALAMSCGNEAESDLQQLVDEGRATLDAPGAILGILYPDGRVAVAASGVADLSSGRAMSPADAFFLGSVSKTYTAALILRLAEGERLSINDPLSRWIPDFPRGDEITLLHLLQHTSGLRDFYQYCYLRPDRDEMIDLVTRKWTQAEMLEMAGRFGHSFDPGADWSYSNTNYFLLGVVAERAAAMSLADAYRHYLLDPLRLDRTWLTLYESDRADLPITGYLGPVEGWGHSEMFGDLGPTTVLDRSNLEWGAGGLAAPAEQAMVFFRALFRGQVVSPDSLRQMTDFLATPALGADSGAEPDVESGYGLGLVRIRRRGYEAIGHGGLFTGHTAGVWYLRESDVVVALFANRGFVGQRRFLDLVAAEAKPM